MKKYIKPEINDEEIEVEDIMGVTSSGVKDINDDTDAVSVKDLWP